MAVSIALPWSDGEAAMHKMLQTPRDDNPTAALMTPQAAFMLQRAPLLGLGALDAQGRPWATVWGGEPGFSQPLGNSIAGIRSPVDRRFDPVVEALTDGKNDGEVVREEGVGRMVAGLPIDLVTRKRVKVYGRMIVASLGRDDGEEGGSVKNDEVGQMQLVVKIEQSLGNCPKYLNKKTITPAEAHPELLSTSANLSPEARALIAKADLFFISSSNGTHDMDCNHRGGPAGFVRVLSSDDSPAATTTLIYPEYSGNRLYQTLGNLHSNPLAGLCFPDFESGDVLYVTGRTSILHGSAAAAALPRTNLAVKLEVTAARLVGQGLTFRGTPVEDGAEGMSPYNPPVRRLAAEGNLLAGTDSSQGAGMSATLVEKELLTPDIARFRFALGDGAPARVEPGQWVALDLSAELDAGYSHMRDDDPKSLNDDFVRTFTVTSTTPAPSSSSSPRLSTHFEITIRRVGPVTSFLFAQHPRRSPLPVTVRGFGGEFSMAPSPSSSSSPSTSSSPATSTPAKETTVPFIAAGVGITPLLAESHLLRPPAATVRLLWTLRLSSPADLGLVRHVLGATAAGVPRPDDDDNATAAAEEDAAGERKKLVGGAPVHPSVARAATLFLTGPAAAELGEGAVEELRATGATVKLRRLGRADLAGLGEEGGKVYLCAGSALRDAVVGWLPGREVVFEDFNF